METESLSVYVGDPRFCASVKLVNSFIFYLFIYFPVFLGIQSLSVYLQNSLENINV
jgi:hypothetical protein